MTIDWLDFDVDFLSVVGNWSSDSRLSPNSSENFNSIATNDAISTCTSPKSKKHGEKFVRILTMARDDETSPWKLVIALIRNRYGWWLTQLVHVLEKDDRHATDNSSGRNEGNDPVKVERGHCYRYFTCPIDLVYCPTSKIQYGTVQAKGRWTVPVPVWLESNVWVQFKKSIYSSNANLKQNKRS